MTARRRVRAFGTDVGRDDRALESLVAAASAARPGVAGAVKPLRPGAPVA